VFEQIIALVQRSTFLPAVFLPSFTTPALLVGRPLLRID
jgi:hypothetical protein